MADADLLLTILEAGDIVGRDDIGRTVIELVVARPDLEPLMAFGADAVEREDDGDDEASARTTATMRRATRCRCQSAGSGKRIRRSSGHRFKLDS
jgi:hypothetical protein